MSAQTSRREAVKTTGRKEGPGNKDAGGVVCEHDDQGTCSIHGPGAKKMETPVRVNRTFKNGTTRSVLTKKKWFKCELGMRGGMLRQQRLSFNAVTDAKGTGKRDNKGNLGK